MERQYICLLISNRCLSITPVSSPLAIEPAWVCLPLTPLFHPSPPHISCRSSSIRIEAILWLIKNDRRMLGQVGLRTIVRGGGYQDISHVSISSWHSILHISSQHSISHICHPQQRSHHHLSGPASPAPSHSVYSCTHSHFLPTHLPWWAPPIVSQA